MHWGRNATVLGGRDAMRSTWRRRHSATAAATFDPSVETLTGWWRASYVSPTMPGVASAGTSGANGLAVDADADGTPVAGTLQNGFAPASFVGTALETVAAMSTFFAGGTGTAVMCALAPSAAATVGVFSDPAFLTDRGSQIALTFSTSGVGAGVFDGTSQKTRTLACSTAAYHLIAMRWDASLLKLRVDTTDATPIATVGVAPTLTGRVVFAKNPGLSFLNYSLLDAAFYASSVADATLTNWKSYYNSRYGLSL